MKKILLTTAGIIGLAALAGCADCSNGSAGGAWAGYDGSFDDGTHGYERSIAGYDGRAQPAPPPSYFYPPQGYGPQNRNGYSNPDCPPPMPMRGY